MSKSLLAFVWIAGPLTGTLVQPYVGLRSDNCRSPLGKRKPFMIGGGIATIASLLLLAWTRDIIRAISSIFDAEPKSESVKWLCIIFATICMYALDFAVNTVQAGIRAFIVDNCPSHQQEESNAWASRLTGAGNIIGYYLGFADLPRAVPFFGNTQFKCLCSIASIGLAISLAISCFYIKERDPRLEGPPPENQTGLITFFSLVFKSARRLPLQIQRVCQVQLFAWVAWFPFLFYMTTYIGQIYVNPIFEEHPNPSDDEIDDAWEHATRVGTFALFIFAITSFSANIILPFVVTPTTKGAAHIEQLTSTPSHINPSPHESQNLPSRRQRFWNRFDLSILRIPGLTLRRTWLLAHILFALCMFSTFFISSTRAAIVMTGFVGFSWSLTLWAPFALIAAEVSKRDVERQRLRRAIQSQAPIASSSTTPTFLKTDDAADQAGIVLGLHNVAISAPQIFSTLVSSVVFRALQKPRGVPWDDSVGWVLRFGGIAAVGAAWATGRVGDE